MLDDLRYAARTLRKTPAFTGAAIATLALGIGANTAIFQLLDAVRLRALPVGEPERLARIQIRNGNQGFGIIDNFGTLTFPLFEQIQANQKGFSNVFGWELDQAHMGENSQARKADVLSVSGGFFPGLEIRPLAGRLFRADDDQPDCSHPGVVVGYEFWRSELGGRFTAIGTRLTVEGQGLEIIGVTPPEFSGPEVGRSFDIALPLCAFTVLHHGDRTPFRQRDYFWLYVMGRLRREWTLARASEQLEAISPALIQATEPSGYSRSALDVFAKFKLEAAPGSHGTSHVRDDYNRSLWILLGITGFVLFIACGNLANLMLARASAREREFALRVALGANRTRLIRQALSESMLLAFCGAGLGIYVARTLSSAIVRLLNTEDQPLQLDLGLDWRMIAFTSAATLGVCICVGLAGALSSASSQPERALKSGVRTAAVPRQFRLQRLLVVLQIAISLGLVTGALLFVGSFRRLLTLDPGFREQGIVAASFDMSRLGLRNEGIRPSRRQLVDEVRAAPLVADAASTSNLLIGGGMWSLSIRAKDAKGWSRFSWVSPGYFGVLDTPLDAGRDFNEGDRESSSKVAIVNQTFARQFFGAANPLGQVFRTAAEPNYPETSYQVVGLIKDTKYSDVREPAPPIAYGPMSQYPDLSPYINMYIRSSAPLSAVESAVRRRVSAWQPAIGMEFHVLRKQITDGLVRERVLALLSGFFGVLAAILAIIGLYGLLAYTLGRRRNEVGIRMALGATKAQILKLIMGEAAVLVTIGLGIGVVCSLAITLTARSLLFGISASDPLTFLGATVVLAAAAAAGSAVPALRASGLDPMAALREE